MYLIIIFSGMKSTGHVYIQNRNFMMKHPQILHPARVPGISVPETQLHGTRLQGLLRYKIEEHVTQRIDIMSTWVFGLACHTSSQTSEVPKLL